MKLTALKHTSDSFSGGAIEVTGNSYLVTATISENKKLAIDIPDNYFGEALMYFQVTDDTGESAVDGLVIAVNASDDPTF